MARNILVATNPAKRRKLSPKQRAAAIRNLKKARAARRKPKRRRNPSKAATPVASNPRRKPAKRRAVRRNPVRASRRFSIKRIVEGQLMPALVGGVGAVANDIGYSFLLNRIPVGAAGGIVDQLRAGPFRHVGKATSALLLAYLSSMVLPRRTADQLGAGAVTVVGYNVVRDVLARFAPELALGAYIAPELGYAGAGVQARGGTRLDPRTGSNYRSSGLEAYLAPKLRGLSSVRQLSQRGQLRQGDPYTARRPVTMEGYSEGGGA